MRAASAARRNAATSSKAVRVCSVIVNSSYGWPAPSIQPASNGRLPYGLAAEASSRNSYAKTLDYATMDPGARPDSRRGSAREDVDGIERARSLALAQNEICRRVLNDDQDLDIYQRRSPPLLAAPPSRPLSLFRDRTCNSSRVDSSTGALDSLRDR